MPTCCSWTSLQTTLIFSRLSARKIPYDYRGAYIVISHDRYFLDKVTNRTIELENCHIRDYKGNYTRFLELKAEDLERRRKEYEAKMREIGRIEGIIDQQKRWNQAPQLRDHRKQAETDRPHSL